MFAPCYIFLLPASVTQKRCRGPLYVYILGQLDRLRVLPTIEHYNVHQERFSRAFSVKVLAKNGAGKDSTVGILPEPVLGREEVCNSCQDINCLPHLEVSCTNRLSHFQLIPEVQ